jgi:hypothetical protein
MSSERFNQLVEIGKNWQDEVRNKFESMGFVTNGYGQEGLLEKQFHKAIRKMNYNSTARFIRFVPDLVVAIENKCCFLVEAKSEKKENYNSLNYSYQIDSYDVGVLLHKIGVDVLVVFEEWRACFVHNIKFWKKYTDPDYLKTVSGSGTPFGLVHKVDVPLFDDFINSILNPYVVKTKVPLVTEQATIVDFI